MKKVKIVTDSCSDLSKELLDTYDIDYAKMSTILDGTSSPALLEWNKDDVHEFYEIMRGGKRITTSQVSVEEFNRIFKFYLDKDYDIVYIGCSSKQSGSVNTGSLAAKKILESYPDSKISCIDSLNASFGIGILAIEAAKMAKDGKNINEITEYITSVRKKVQQFVTVHSLDTLRKAGRVSASSAFFGNLMGVKPILISDAHGTQVAFKKVKGRQASFREIVNSLNENAVDIENQTVYIAHADCSDDEVEAICELVKEKINCKDIIVGYIGPIIGASVGPDTVGVWAFGNEVTFSGEDK